MPGKKMITYGSHGATRAVANFIGAECTPEPWLSPPLRALFELDNNVASTACIDFDQSLFCLHCHDLSSALPRPYFGCCGLAATLTIELRIYWCDTLPAVGLGRTMFGL